MEPDGGTGGGTEPDLIDFPRVFRLSSSPSGGIHFRVRF